MWVDLVDWVWGFSRSGLTGHKSLGLLLSTDLQASLNLCGWETHNLLILDDPRTHSFPSLKLVLSHALCFSAIFFFLFSAWPISYLTKCGLLQMTKKKIISAYLAQTCPPCGFELWIYSWHSEKVFISDSCSGTVCDKDCVFLEETKTWHQPLSHPCYFPWQSCTSVRASTDLLTIHWENIYL